MKKNLEELKLPYGQYTLKLKVTADGYEDSNFSNEVIYTSMPRVKKTNSISIEVYGLIDGVTGVQVYIDDVLAKTVDYTAEGASVPFVIDLTDVNPNDNATHNVRVVAAGEGVPENTSNTVAVYFGEAQIFSVSGEGASNPTLTRGDSAEGLGYTLNADGSITSDFDNCRPWSDITEVTDDKGNVFIRVPKHYTRYTFDESGYKKTEICVQKPDDTWLLNPIFTDGNGVELDYVDIGKYTASGSSSLAKSVSGASPLVNININDMRNACKANGTGYQQYDIWAHVMLQDLFKVEFATTNAQSIMYGYANNNSAAIASGRTDGVLTASGSEISNTDGKHAMKYRGVENWYGNVYQWMDGITVNSLKPYVCKDPTKYVSGSLPADYSAVSYNGVSGGNSRVKKLGYDATNPFVQVPTDLGGSDTTYYCDYGYYSSSTYRVVYVGGYWGGALGAGPWCFGAGSDATGSDSVVGGRLLRRPL